MELKTRAIVLAVVTIVLIVAAVVVVQGAVGSGQPTWGYYIGSIFGIAALGSALLSVRYWRRRDDRDNR